MTLPGLARSTLKDLGDSALAALVEHWPGSPAPPLPDRRFVSNGLVFWDCEQVAVTFERMYAGDGDVSAEQWVQFEPIVGHRFVIMEVTILRTVPDIGSRGARPVVPTPDQIEGSAVDLYGDAIDVWNCLHYADRRGELVMTPNSLAFQDWIPLGPDGGFGGGQTRVRCALL